jgi:hypothetical protein
MKEDKKYVWWGILGIGVAAFFYFLSSKNQKQTIQVPYLVPKPIATNGASPTADTTISEQPNIIGSHPNSNIPNGSNFTINDPGWQLPPSGIKNNVSGWNPPADSTAPPGQMINPGVSTQSA